jgi:hypothetical protein
MGYIEWKGISYKISPPDLYSGAQKKPHNVFSSDNTVVFTSPVKPDAPEPPKPDRITRDSVTLSWRPPRNDGGSKIKGYIIQKKGKGDDDWSDVNGTPVPVNVFKVSYVHS